MIKKIKITLFIIVLATSFFHAPKAEACFCGWGEGCAGACLQEMLREAYETIMGMIRGMQKQAALEQSAALVNQSAEDRVITDPYEYIFTNPEEQAYVSTTDFITTMTAGRSSDYIADGDLDYSSIYSSSGGSAKVAGASTAREGIVKGASTWGSTGGNYMQYLSRIGSQSVRETVPQANILNYVSDPTQMFSTGNWRAFSAFISNPANNPFGFSILTQNFYNSKVSELTALSNSLYVAGQGFAPKAVNGKIVTPGVVIKDEVSNSNDFGRKIIAGATNQGEIISATVNRLISKTMQEGIGQIQSNINQLNNSASNYIKQKNSLSPATRFKLSY